MESASGTRSVTLESKSKRRTGDNLEETSVRLFNWYSEQRMLKAMLNLEMLFFNSPRVS